MYVDAAYCSCYNRQKTIIRGIARIFSRVQKLLGVLHNNLSVKPQLWGGVPSTSELYVIGFVKFSQVALVVAEGSCYVPDNYPDHLSHL